MRRTADLQGRRSELFQLFKDTIIKRKPWFGHFRPKWQPHCPPDMCHISFISFVKLRKKLCVFVVCKSFVEQHSSLADTTHYVRISKFLYIPYGSVGRGRCACRLIVIQLLRNDKKPVLLSTLCFKEVAVHRGINAGGSIPGTGSRT